MGVCVCESWSLARLQAGTHTPTYLLPQHVVGFVELDRDRGAGVLACAACGCVFFILEIKSKVTIPSSQQGVVVVVLWLCQWW